MTTDTKPNGIRKAAILVSALSPAAAGQILDQMPPWQAEEVRRLQETLGPIDAEERRAVIKEFFKLSPEGGKKGTVSICRDGPEGASHKWGQSPFSQVEIDESLARKIAGGHGAASVAMRSPRHGQASVGMASEPSDDSSADPSENSQPKSPPFRFLQQAEGDKLVKILANERPQTIALVLAHLPPEQAGAVLVRFAPAVQVEIVRRLVDLEETQPEILREVGRALEVRLSEQVRMQRRRVAGLAAVEGILEASGSEVSAQIFENLSTLDHSLADKLGPQRLEFSELVYQDEPTLATVFTAADRELWMLALVGAPPALVERVLRRLPAAEAEAFRHHLDNLGPTRLSDVEESRRRIEDLVRRLVLQRRITLARRDRPAYQLV
jgi:flagellar motor switch protein FliG